VLSLQQQLKIFLKLLFSGLARLPTTDDADDIIVYRWKLTPLVIVAEVDTTQLTSVTSHVIRKHPPADTTAALIHQTGSLVYHCAFGIIAYWHWKQ